MERTIVSKCFSKISVSSTERSIDKYARHTESLINRKK